MSPYVVSLLFAPLFSREVFTRVAWEATLALLGLSQNGPDFGSSMCVVQMYMLRADIYTSYPDPHIESKMIWPLWDLMHCWKGEHFIFSQHVNTCSWSDWHCFSLLPISHSLTRAHTSGVCALGRTVGRYSECGPNR